MAAELKTRIERAMHAQVFVDVHVVKGNMFSVAINMNMVSQKQKARSVLASHDASAALHARKAGSSSPRATACPPSTQVFLPGGQPVLYSGSPLTFSPVRRKRQAVCEVRSLTALVKQIAVHTIRWGYWWYVSGIIPEHKDPRDIDRRLMDKYAANLSESCRYRRKQQGLANTRYYRFGRRFFIFTSLGHSPIWELEKANLRCIRKPPRNFEKRTGYTGKFPYAPLRIGGYSISYKPGGLTSKGEVDPKWHSHVELHPEAYRKLKATFLELSTKRSADQLGMMFYEVGYEPYKPLLRQLYSIHKQVNQKRRRSGIKDKVPREFVPTRLRPVRVFTA